MQPQLHVVCSLKFYGYFIFPVFYFHFHLLGFKAVELGAIEIDEWTKEQLLAAKNSAGVEVVVLCTPFGEFRLILAYCLSLLVKT